MQPKECCTEFKVSHDGLYGQADKKTNRDKEAGRVPDLPVPHSQHGGSHGDDNEGDGYKAHLAVGCHSLVDRRLHCCPAAASREVYTESQVFIFIDNFSTWSSY